MNDELSILKRAGKYPMMTGFQYGANNPIKYIDVNGDSLKINNVNESLKDLKSIVNSKNQSRVSVNESGIVSVNLDGLSNKQIKKDKGLSLLSEIVTSDKNILYTTGELEEFGKGVLAIGLDNNGVVNASKNGFDSNNKHTILPKEGFDGQLALSSYGSWTTDGGNSRKSILFHELAENFFRAKGVNYHPTNGNQGAHQMAIDREGSTFGNNQPGHYIKYNKPIYSNDQKQVYNYIVRNWKNWKK